MLKRILNWFAPVHKLHIGLYILFMLMVSLGGFTSSMFETVSLADMEGLRTEWQNARNAGASGKNYSFSTDTMIKLLRPLAVSSRTEHVYRGGKWQDRTERSSSSGPGVGWAYFIFLIIWLWPLYRHYLRGGGDIKKISRRIVNLPVVLLGLGWLVALQRCLWALHKYSVTYGSPDMRMRVVFVVSAVVLGTFAGYLNLELTGLYVRNRIARPFFFANDPYGLKEGMAVSLGRRYALMLFSLAMVPLLLCVYLPAAANLDVFSHVAKASEAWQLTLEDLRVLVPLAVVAFIAVVMIGFQLLSMLLYRMNVQGPVRALVRRMQAVAVGDFECKTSVLYADELGQLKGHFNMMLDGLQEREKIKDTFGRYVSMEIAAKIMKSGKVNLAGEEIQATVLFSDIRGFTPLSEKLPPAELIRFLNEYFTYITGPISDNRGVINKFMGDAVMAVFSPVFGVEDHQAAAVRAAIGMRRALKDFNALGRYPEVNFGVGVHSGGLVAGNVGTDERLEYTVLGDTVNVASRIESQTKSAGSPVLVSSTTVSVLNLAAFPGVNFVECAPVLMKGKSKPMVLFKVEENA